MQRFMLKSKIHCASVTEADLHYEGSLGMDENLMEAADLLPGERIDIYNVTNGQRLSTYAIQAPRGSGTICMNGAAARCAAVGDTVIIASYCAVEDDCATEHKPVIVFVDEKNRIQDARSEEAGSRGQ